MTKPRQYHYGGVPRTALQASINDSDELGLVVVIGAAEAASWPTVGPYVVRIERGTPREEAILVSGRSGNNLLVVERGYDNTTPTAHSAGSAVFVEHTFDGAWPNTIDGILALLTTRGDLLVSNGTSYVRLAAGANGRVPVADSAQPAGIRWGVDPLSDLIVAAGDLLYGTAADSASRLPVGTTAYPLTVVGGLPAWAQLTAAGLAPLAVGTSHIQPNAITTPLILDDAVTGAKIAPGAIGPTELAPDAVTPAAIAPPPSVGVYVDPAVGVTTSWADLTAWTSEVDPFNMHAAGVFTVPITGIYTWVVWGQGNVTGTPIRFRMRNITGGGPWHYSAWLPFTELSWETVMFLSVGAQMIFGIRTESGTAGLYLDAGFALIQPL